MRPRKPASVGESVSNDMQEAGSLFGAVRFNALAGSAELARKVASSAGDGVAGELERLAALHASEALDDEEFRQAKARIIGS